MQEAKPQGIARHVNDKLHQFDALPRRPAELEDWLNARVFHPLSGRLALALQHTRATPNMLSLAGFASICAAAFLYGLDGGAAFAALGLAIHLTWHIFDGADGDLARLKGETSALGEVMDGLSDYLGHFVLYGILGYLLAQQIGNAAWAFVLGSALARFAQATFYEAIRRQYQWCVYGQGWLGTDRKRSGERGWFLGAITGPYLALASVFLRENASFKARLSKLPTQDRDRAIALTKREYAPFLRNLHVLNANYRTVLLGIAMIQGVPLYYFVFETAFLSGALCILIFRNRGLTRRISAQLPPSISR